jgi:hypothetical protein
MGITVQTGGPAKDRCIAQHMANDEQKEKNAADPYCDLSGQGFFSQNHARLLLTKECVSTALSPSPGHGHGLHRSGRDQAFHKEHTITFAQYHPLFFSQTNAISSCQPLSGT